MTGLAVSHAAPRPNAWARALRHRSGFMLANTKIYHRLKSKEALAIIDSLQVQFSSRKPPIPPAETI